MKKNIKKIIIITLIIGIFTIPSYAANTTNTTNAVSESNTTNNTVTPKKTTKSNNANLSNLGIIPHDFSGFKESKTEYDVSVPNTITEVEVYAMTKDSNSSITGTGKIKLQEGENAAKIVVTAEDGTTKTYTINIKRLKSGEKETQSTQTNNLALEKLEISGVSLQPSFNKDIHQYKVEIDESKKQLDIVAEANQENTKINIIGNENIINGQNIITIMVSDEKETQMVTYQIYANKNFVKQEELNQQLDEAERQYQLKIWIIRILIIVIVICIIILLTIIYKKTNSNEYKSEKAQKRLAKATKKLVKEDVHINKKGRKNKIRKKSGKHSK